MPPKFCGSLPHFVLSAHFEGGHTTVIRKMTPNFDDLSWIVLTAHLKKAMQVIRQLTAQVEPLVINICSLRASIVLGASKLKKAKTHNEVLDLHIQE